MILLIIVCGFQPRDGWPDPDPDIFRSSRGRAPGPEITDTHGHSRARAVHSLFFAFEHRGPVFGIHTENTEDREGSKTKSNKNNQVMGSPCLGPRKGDQLSRLLLRQCSGPKDIRASYAPTFDGAISRRRCYYMWTKIKRRKRTTGHIPELVAHWGNKIKETGSRTGAGARLGAACWRGWCAGRACTRMALPFGGGLGLGLGASPSLGGAGLELGLSQPVGKTPTPGERKKKKKKKKMPVCALSRVCVS
jgi:hypothetical protein